LIGVWQRDMLRRSTFNRSLFLVAVTGPLYMALLWYGCAALGLSSTVGEILLMCVWSVQSSCLAFLSDKRFGLTSVTCALGFLLAIARPDLRYPILSAVNVSWVAAIFLVGRRLVARQPA
jgi:hypothetical protein